MNGRVEGPYKEGDPLITPAIEYTNGLGHRVTEDIQIVLQKSEVAIANAAYAQGHSEGRVEREGEVGERIQGIIDGAVERNDALHLSGTPHTDSYENLAAVLKELDNLTQALEAAAKLEGGGDRG